MGILATLASTLLLMGTPEIRRLGDECVIVTKDIQAIELRQDYGLWIRLRTGVIHPICPMRVADPQAKLNCELYLRMLSDARQEKRTVKLTYREHYDCRKSFGERDYVVEILALAVE